MAIRVMTRGLAQAGIKVDIATTDDNGSGRLCVPYETPLSDEGVTYWYFPRQTRFYTFSWPLTRWLWRHAHDFDLIHIHALFSYPAVIAAHWARRKRVPYIVRPLGVLNRWGLRNRRAVMKKLSFHFLERGILSGAAAVHYTSEEERLQAAELGVSQRCVIIPNAADLPDLKRYGPGCFRARNPQYADRLLILFLSRLDPIKGLDLLLPAFAQLRAQVPRVVLVLAGNAERNFARDLRNEAVRLGVDSDVVWAGFLDEDEKWAAIADANVIVLPSYSENFGLAAVEAMAYGRCIVISDRVAIHREVARFEAGLVIPCEVNALACALKQALIDDHLRARVEENGKRLVETHFSSRAVTQNLLELYARITQPAVRSGVAGSA